ncbi:MAG TPA: methyltransferase domain-containing protein [Terriglobales bacterium]|jgi:trans-aconitate methyltransferase|nr:methyltransferase domain-containing protein [Terriglobales bacterium]
MPQVAHQWNPADYARHSQGQEVFARELIASLNLQPNEDVLDLGCGDGRMTAEIAKLAPAGRVVGVDRSGEMVAFAAENFYSSNLSFQVADAAALPFREEFDTVYSSAVLHWVPDHNAALAGIARSLRPGGRCLLQMGGKGNGVEMTRAFEQTGAKPSGFTYAFHGAEEYRGMVEAAGLVADSVALIPKDMLHSSLAALTGWLRTAWQPYHRDIPEEHKASFLETVTHRYAQAHPAEPDGAFHVLMMRLQVRAHKARGKCR